MAERPDRRTPTTKIAHVRRTEWITPQLVRIVLGGDGLAEFEAGAHTDHYVKLLFPGENGEDRPRMRTYTVRRWDPEALELWLDVVVHGDEGLAGPWAKRLRPGDEVRFRGPGGAYSPDPAADWHLLAGDESALPAIAASLERLAPGARAHVFVEVHGQEDEQEIETAGDVTLTWLHRGDAPVGKALVHAVSGLDFLPGSVHAFVHGEAGLVKELRRLLLVERRLPRERVSISGYWRLDHDEDRWQATKRDWNRQVEEEQDSAATG